MFNKYVFEKMFSIAFLGIVILISFPWHIMEPPMEWVVMLWVFSFICAFALVSSLVYLNRVILEGWFRLLAVVVSVTAIGFGWIFASLFVDGFGAGFRGWVSSISLGFFIGATSLLIVFSLMFWVVRWVVEGFKKH